KRSNDPDLPSLEPKLQEVKRNQEKDRADGQFSAEINEMNLPQWGHMFPEWSGLIGVRKSHVV
ncbi:MAG: hypothetical protein AB1847_21210, partial [bacterium]